MAHGAPWQRFAITALLGGLRQNSPQLLPSQRTIVLTMDADDEEWAPLKCEFDLVINSHLLELAAADPYYIKLSLGRFVAREMGPRDRLLYLDYDHLSMGTVDVPTCAPGEIWVSSESDQLGRSPNTSLILADANTLAAVCGEWHQSYKDLRETVSVRHREEIAFGLSAARAGVRLRPVPKTLQGCWASVPNECGLFHYGGTSTQATFLKSAMMNIASRTAKPMPASEAASSLLQLFLLTHGCT
jgi:hypothetical protein